MKFVACRETADLETHTNDRLKVAFYAFINGVSVDFEFEVFHWYHYISVHWFSVIPIVIIQYILYDEYIWFDTHFVICGPEIARF